MSGDIAYSVKIRIGDKEFEVIGDKEFVEKHFDEWKTKLVESTMVAPSNIVIQKDEAVSTEGLKEIDLGEFYIQKRPQTQNETIVTFGAYFKDYEGKDEFDHKDLLQAFDNARIKRPKNIHDALSKCFKRSGYIIPVARKKGFWRLSQPGIDQVALMPKGGSMNDKK